VVQSPKIACFFVCGQGAGRGVAERMLPVTWVESGLCGPVLLHNLYSGSFSKEAGDQFAHDYW
jgi:hypothetical protein